MKLVVVCPGGAVTGGPEALHQLVHVANVVEPGSAAVLYWPFDGRHETPEPYRKYGVPQVSRAEVPGSALVVLPEIWPDMAHTFRNRCALWWLSVDNFGAHGQRNLDRIGLHLCQSEYAWRFVEGFGERLRLTDWVDVEMVAVDRVPRVVVNPAKDDGLLWRFVEMNQGCEFGLLKGLSRVEVANLLRSSDIYVDFGRHPGRDRPPREAALAGCVVLSVALGSARLHEDMPIDSRYKFDSLDSACSIFDAVRSDWVHHFDAQEPYRQWVAGQRGLFESEVRGLLDVC